MAALGREWVLLLGGPVVAVCVIVIGLLRREDVSFMAAIVAICVCFLIAAYRAWAFQYVAAQKAAPKIIPGSRFVPPPSGQPLRTRLLLLSGVFVLAMAFGPMRSLLIPTSAPQALATIAPTPVTRMFTQRRLNDLLGFYSGRTAAEGDRLLAPYIGKYIALHAHVGNISKSLTNDDIEVEFKETGPAVLLTFSSAWHDRLDIMGEGSEIIAAISSGVMGLILLDNCALASE
jgi:hypothetical protein